MKNSILIATPAYGGLLHSKYVTSIVTTCNEFAARGILHGLYIIPNESLISRARNRCAAFALQRGFEKLLFIDADLGWKLSDIQAIVDSSKRVVGGTYPLKQMSPTRLSYNPPADLVFPEHIALRSYDELQYLKQHFADLTTGEVSVRHIPTGFMMIDCSVFKALQAFVPHYLQENSGTGEFEKHHDYFPVRLSGEMYESEDWAFCSLVREHLDCGIWLNTHVVLSHTGVHTFTAEADSASQVAV
jgi:hypothetical protein